MSNYDKYFYELVDQARLMGVEVKTRQTEDFELSTYGAFDATDKSITLYYEKELLISKETLFCMAHEFRHALQYLTGFHKDYWYFSCGLGEKPATEIKDEIEKDADEWAIAYLKGRSIRVPKHMLGDDS